MTINNKDQIPGMRIDAELFKMIQAEAESEFCSISEVVRIRLAMIYAEGNPTKPLPKTAAALSRERKQEIENELLEFKLAKERRETLTVDQVLEIVQKDYSNIRSLILGIPGRTTGFSPDQIKELNKVIQDCMTELSGEQKETWDDLAGN